MSLSATATSASGTRQLGIGIEALGTAFELCKGAAVFTRGPDVEPFAVELVDRDPLRRVHERVHELRKVEVVVGDVAENRRLVDVDAHAHGETQLGLLDVSGDMLV